MQATVPLNGAENQDDPMANTKSARKRARQTPRRTLRNTALRSRLRTQVRKANEARESGDAQAALDAFRQAESELARAGQRGLLHRKAARRKISRLNTRLRKLRG